MGTFIRDCLLDDKYLAADVERLGGFYDYAAQASDPQCVWQRRRRWFRGRRAEWHTAKEASCGCFADYHGASRRSSVDYARASFAECSGWIRGEHHPGAGGCSQGKSTCICNAEQTLNIVSDYGEFFPPCFCASSHVVVIIQICPSRQCCGWSIHLDIGSS